MALTRIQLGLSSSAKLLYGQLTGNSNSLVKSMTPIIRHRSSASKDSGEWDLYAALCLQRTPVIGPELNWIERRLKEYLNKVEIVDSLYSDHEMRHFEDL